MKTQVERLRDRAMKMSDRQLTLRVMKLHNMTDQVARFADLIGVTRQNVYKWLRGGAVSSGYRRLLESMFVEQQSGAQR